MRRYYPQNISRILNRAIALGEYERKERFNRNEVREFVDSIKHVPVVLKARIEYKLKLKLGYGRYPNQQARVAGYILSALHKFAPDTQTELALRKMIESAGS